MKDDFKKYYDAMDEEVKQYLGNREMSEEYLMMWSDKRTIQDTEFFSLNDKPMRYIVLNIKNGDNVTQKTDDKIIRA